MNLLALVPKEISKKLFGLYKSNLQFIILALATLMKKKEKLSDVAVTNNDDSRKVLATVAAAIHDFTIQYSGAWIIAKGSTLSRTRLYRIGITNHLKEITADLKYME